MTLKEVHIIRIREDPTKKPIITPKIQPKLLIIRKMIRILSLKIYIKPSQVKYHSRTRFMLMTMIEIHKIKYQFCYTMNMLTKEALGNKH